ncbi:hypothetical protein COLO4_14912 [Corchorus olitorius]|uniref:LRAT domain-containing protein n=1 Tax=Corchorus olitorius TaxID=93759 RepID=A0A1R3JQ94_9ROSI|nr:hypothetical protein COLO4_14912 [Corchorus olitorius]
MRPVGRDQLQPADHIYSDRKEGRIYHHGIYVGKCKVSNPENGEEKEIDNAVIHFFGHNSKLTSDEQCKRCYPPYDEIDNPVIDLKKATSQQCERCFLPSDENGEEKEKRKAVTNLFALLKKEATSQECESCFPPSKNGGVSITCLDCFLGGKSLYVYEYHVCYLKLLFKQSGTCTVHRSKPPDEVIQTAFALLKENSFGEYHLYENNCEDFATYCKTGKPTSNQVAGNLYGFCLCGIVTYNAKKDRNPLPHFCLPFCGALSVPCQFDNKEAMDIVLQAGGSNASSVPITKSLAELLSLVDNKEAVDIVLQAGAMLNIPSDSHNAFLVLVGFVITTTYQPIFNPPGGVRQAEAAGSSRAGRSIMATSSFLWFYIPNTTSFLITLFGTFLFLIIGPYGEFVLLPLLPLVVCYVMSTLVDQSLNKPQDKSPQTNN